MLNQLLPGQPDDAAGDPIQRALEAVRKHLGMEVAYISEFSDTRSSFRNVDAPGLEAMIKVGDSYALDDIYCRHIMAGRLPELMCDVADHELARGLPITSAATIGAHMSVPIRLQDGRDYGMFCCLSPTPNHSLNQRDLDVMRAFAEMTAHQISKEVDAARATKGSRDRIEQVIETAAFAMVYQPIFSFEPYRITGYEALCRFDGLPYRTPDLWFNEATGAGLGVRMELRVVAEALAAFQNLPDDVFISVNLSPETLLSGKLGDVLRGQPIGRLVLEVTEHAQVADYAELVAALAPFRRAGAQLAIDDAGAGYSSLQHILQLKPDIIKLDIGLTRGVDSDPARRALATALAHFERETGAVMVAEGIETQAELEALKIIGIQKGQGYLLGRPAKLPDPLHPLATVDTLSPALVR